MTWKEMERRKRWVSINKWWAVERVLFVCRVIYRHCPLNTRTHTHMLTSRGRERRRQRERERLFAFSEALCLSAHICLKASWRAGKRLNWRRCEWARVNERQRECMYVRERESEGERERGRGALHPCSLLKTEPVVLHSEVPQAEEERAGNIKLCFACAVCLATVSVSLSRTSSPLCLQVITPFRRLILCAENRKEMEDWISSLKSVQSREHYEVRSSSTD